MTLVYSYAIGWRKYIEKYNSNLTLHCFSRCLLCFKQRHIGLSWIIHIHWDRNELLFLIKVNLVSVHICISLTGVIILSSEMFVLPQQKLHLQWEEHKWCGEVMQHCVIWVDSEGLGTQQSALFHHSLFNDEPFPRHRWHVSRIPINECLMLCVLKLTFGDEPLQRYLVNGISSLLSLQLLLNTTFSSRFKPNTKVTTLGSTHLFYV